MPGLNTAFSLRTLLLALCITSSTVACKGTTAAKSSASVARADTLPDSTLISIADAGRYEGSEKAPIWIVMVSDFQCPYCKVWHDSTLAEVRRNYISTGKARLAYLNLPLQMHRQSRNMAQAAMCASAQKKFWPYADTLFARQQAIGDMTDAMPALFAIAHELQIDSIPFAHCMVSPAMNALIAGDMAQADKGHVRSTPSFFVGQFLLEGAVPFSGFKQAVDSALVLAEKKH
jgi:protein-disulfide isomerase